ncbi:MAG TPA: hypothetical protein V6D37_17860 [Candidatus Sericytochromatia bacterium]|jgi:hypothetical protein
MATVERIEQDLAALEKAIALLKVDFHSTYSQYLKLLGQAVRQQLILASYQICTQGYPEAFLGLSFNQRQNLQQAVLRLGKQVQEQLLSHLEPSQPLPETETQTVDDAPPEDEEPPEAPQEEMQFEMVGVDDLLDAAESEDERPLSQPEQLLEWQEQLEKAIAQTLQTLSLDTNRLLQKNGIIPDKLPPAVLEAAVQVEASNDAATGSPNLLNLLMEAENEDGEKEDSTLMRIVAINLRLSEIEFADPTLSAGRNQIRKLSARVSSFQREYHKKQRERAVAQAEAAWRSSWFDE